MIQWIKCHILGIHEWSEEYPPPVPMPLMSIFLRKQCLCCGENRYWRRNAVIVMSVDGCYYEPMPGDDKPIPDNQKGIIK